MKPLLLSLLSTLAVLLGFTGLALVGVGLRRMAKASRSRRWPSVPGTVLSSTVSSRMAPPSSQDEDSPPEVPQRLYRPEVRYTYSVGGREFTGSALGLDEVEISDEPLVREQAARYPPDAAVTVYYDPADPSQAVLEPGVQASAWLLPAMGLVFLIVTGSLYLFVRWYSGR